MNSDAMTGPTTNPADTRGRVGQWLWRRRGCGEPGSSPHSSGTGAAKNPHPASFRGRCRSFPESLKRYMITLVGIVTYNERLGVAAGLHGVAVLAPGGSEDLTDPPTEILWRTDPPRRRRMSIVQR